MKVSKKNKKCFNYLKFGVPLVLGGLILFGLFFQYSKIKNKPNASKENVFEEKEATIKENFAQTKDFSTPDLSIGIIADAHAGQEFGFQKLNSAVSVIKEKEEVNFIVNLGDLIEGRAEYKKIDRNLAKADLKKANQIISRYSTVHNVLGNHGVFSLSKDDIKKTFGNENYHYSFDENGYQIIILDANFYSSGKIIDVDNKNKIVYKGFLPNEQLGWLQERLKKSDKNIIFIHHPIYGLDNNLEVEKIIFENKSSILLIANGHRHPKALRISTFGGVPIYDIPSLEFQDSYVVLKLFDEEIFPISKKLSE